MADDGAALVRELRNAELSGESTDTREWLGRTGELAKGGVDELVGLLTRLERAIVMTDRALRVSQPPIEGQLGIRWWVTRTGGGYRTPVLVTWKRVRGNRWRAKRLKRLRRDWIMRKGTASMNADHTYELAVVAQQLIADYVTLSAELRALARKASSRDHLHRHFDYLEARLISEHRQALDNLEAADYAVDHHMRTLADRYLEP